MINQLTSLIVLSFFLTFNVQSQNSLNQKRVNYFTSSVFSLTEVMFHDVINPPAAARFYAYSTLSANLIVEDYFGTKPSLTSALNRPINFPVRNSKTQIDPYFASTYALLATGRTIIPSGYSLEVKQNELYKNYLKLGVKKEVLDSSLAFAKRVTKVIADMAKKDGYLKLSVLRRYELKQLRSTWQPTPPEYMAAVEPHWKTIKTFFIDSANKFAPKPPIAFDSTISSPFYELMSEVHSTSKSLSQEQLLIARYWDCNPFAFYYSGHVNIGIKKISPGGHWMNITGITCRKAGISFERTVLIHNVVAMGLHDAFISCWDEKYRSDRLRPKTAINRYIDKNWSPVLETPPFPEYTSGHSVISSASATLLTHFFGDNFEFTDNTEVLFGMQERKFNSFYQAAHEAALSRLYGGIHFRDAIEEGEKEGIAIGNYIISKIK